MVMSQRDNAFEQAGSMDSARCFSEFPPEVPETQQGKRGKSQQFLDRNPKAR
jgi:hypothetical protein